MNGLEHVCQGHVHQHPSREGEEQEHPGKDERRQLADCFLLRVGATARLTGTRQPLVDVKGDAEEQHHSDNIPVNVTVFVGSTDPTEGFDEQEPFIGSNSGNRHLNGRFPRLDGF